MYAPEVRDLKNPIPTSEESIARGKHEFETYCRCHGEDGRPRRPPITRSR